MARGAGTRVPDATVEASVAAGFQSTVGRVATPAELETLRPLWQVAGYQEDDMIWRVVFLFAKQLAAVEDSVWKSSDLIRSTSDVVHNSAEQLAAATKVAGEQARAEFRSTVGEIVRQHRWLRFTSGLVVGASVILAGAVYLFEPEHGVMDHLVDGIDPELVARMALSPDTVRAGRSPNKTEYLQLELTSCDFSIVSRSSGTCRIIMSVEWVPSVR